MKAWFLRRLAWLALAAVFFLFTYNSGYGFDALEYLILAQATIEGHSIFEFSPSKSPGIFSVVALWLKFFPHAGHLEFSMLITMLFLLVVGMVYQIVKSSLGRTAAYWSAGWVALSGFFMEMNFLEPEPFVVLLSLPALPMLRNGLRRRALLPFGFAGALIGAAAFFKSVALFYAIGAAVFVAAWARKKNNDLWPAVYRYLFALAAGLTLMVLAPVLFYAGRGEAGAFLYWAYVFPVFLYPSDTVFLSKLLVKLAWFWLALAAGGLSIFHRSVRAVLAMCIYPTAALSLGLAALLALTKNQASHYVFPAAAFLSIFLGAVVAALQERAAGFRHVWLAAAVMVLVLVFAVGMYRPRAVLRLRTITDYAWEQRLAHRLQCIVPKDQTMLCLSHPLPYWLARRLPAIPSYATHVHFARHFQRDPQLLLRALHDPRLAVVEFDPLVTTFRAPSLKNNPAARAALEEFHAHLQQHFRPVSIPDSPYRFWVRTQGPGT